VNYPIDFTEDMRRMGICGVLAIAVSSNVTMAQAHAACERNKMPHQKRHVRRTYDEQIIKSIQDFGYLTQEVPVERQTVRKWVSTSGSGTFLVFVSGHVLTVRNGMVLDQEAHASADVHPARRRFVQKVYSID